MSNDLKPNPKAMRVLPSVIEEAISLNYDVVINTHGYFIGGFYGCNPKNSGLVMDDTYIGHVLLLDSNQENVMLAFDHRGKKHAVSSFDDLIKLNHHVWKGFVKDIKYKNVNEKWFKHLYDRGMLEINPKK